MKTKTVKIDLNILENKNLTQAADWCGVSKSVFIKRACRNFKKYFCGNL